MHDTSGANRLINQTLEYTLPLTIKELSAILNTPAVNIIGHFLQQGRVYNINHSLSEEELQEVCSRLAIKCSIANAQQSSDLFENLLLHDDETLLVPRAPVIAVMGHVDHGKTTLLDYLRKSRVAAEEIGGITQRTVAYQVNTPGGAITFLDTPGHEAFSAMRARGAQVTDIVILVVAADEPLQPQTREALDHIRAANVPVIVFLNKIDRQGAQVEKITQALMGIGLIPDDQGGDTPFIQGSALNGQGVAELLEAILLQGEVLALRANPKRLAAGSVLECSLDRGRGAVVSALIRSGTLMRRDHLIIGRQYGRVRTIQATDGENIERATPSMPVMITGIKECPLPGDILIGCESETVARDIIEKDLLSVSGQVSARQRPQSGLRLLNLVIRSDNQGSAEALVHALAPLANNEAQVHILRAAPGEITQADVLLAQASGAYILCYATRINNDAKLLAQENRVEVITSRIIYDAINAVKRLLRGLKTPVYKSIRTGEALILQLFYYSRVGTIAGCTMNEGYVVQDANVEVIRRGEVIHSSRIDSLRRSTRDVPRVEKGYEFGLHIHNFDEIQVNDTLRFYKSVLVDEEEEDD